MIQVRDLGLVPYEPVYQEMLNYTLSRGDSDDDQLWFLQHSPVFTQGQAGKPEHLLFTGDIPVIQTDRGGQVTYHGPGQLVVYLLLNLKKRGLGSRVLVEGIERALVNTLEKWDIKAYPRDDAPGVYVNERKIASLGLRIKSGCSFHGLALNIDMDLEPFQRINPCGYANMQMTQMCDETSQNVKFDEVAKELAVQLQQELLVVEAKHE